MTAADGFCCVDFVVVCCWRCCCVVPLFSCLFDCVGMFEKVVLALWIFQYQCFVVCVNRRNSCFSLMCCTMLLELRLTLSPSIEFVLVLSEAACRLCDYFYLNVCVCCCAEVIALSIKTATRRRQRRPYATDGHEHQQRVTKASSTYHINWLPQHYTRCILWQLLYTHFIQYMTKPKIALLYAEDMSDGVVCFCFMFDDSHGNQFSVWCCWAHTKRTFTIPLAQIANNPVLLW